VWICPYPGGHIQATRVDAAGRKQYLYHPRRRERRDMEKFEDMLVFARALPKLRTRVDAVRNASYGLATMEKSHVSMHRGVLVFDYPAKSGKRRVQAVIAAVALAVSEEAAATETGRKRAITRAIREVAHYLGNTPAVARASYIDPRVYDRYRDGEIIDHRLVAAAEPTN
jgi:DNA topoisomerase IB